MNPNDTEALRALQGTVARLRALPEPKATFDWSAYDSFAVDPQTQSDLLEILALHEDQRLGAEDAESLAIHAWRALAQQGTSACVPQLVASLTAAFDDSAFEELPAAIARFGAAAIADLRRALLDEPLYRSDTAAFGAIIGALERIGTGDPESKPGVCAVLREKLGDCLHNPPELNAYLIVSLGVLHDADSIPEIGAAFAHDVVSSDMVDWQFVRKHLEVGPKPPRLPERQGGSGAIQPYAGNEAMAKLLRSAGSHFAVDELACFLLGSVVAIEMVKPSALMDVILQDFEGAPVEFATEGQGRYFLGQVMALWNEMAAFQDRLFELPALPGPFADLSDRGMQTLHAMHQQGRIGAFLDGFKMGSLGVREPELWQDFVTELEARDKELSSLTDSDAGGTTEQLAAALAGIRQYWTENYLRFAGSCQAVRRNRRRKQQFAAAHRSVGRNDPCPCGSGKKFKRCCLM